MAQAVSEVIWGLTLTVLWQRERAERDAARATCACDKRGRATGRATSTRCEARGVITADKRRVIAYAACR